MAEPKFQLRNYLRLLHDYEVDYVIVGGVAARLQGARNVTQDLDIMLDSDRQNLERFATALSRPGTRWQSISSAAFEPHETLSADELETNEPIRYSSKFGVLDVLGELPEVGGYDNVKRKSRRYDFDGMSIWVSDLDDVITSKSAADRMKDLHALAPLKAARDHLREFGDDYELSLERLITDGDD